MKTKKQKSVVRDRQTSESMVEELERLCLVGDDASSLKTVERLIWRSNSGEVSKELLKRLIGISGLSLAFRELFGRQLLDRCDTGLSDFEEVKTMLPHISMPRALEVCKIAVGVF